MVTALMPVAEGKGDTPFIGTLSVRHAWAQSSSGVFSFRVVSRHEVGIHVQDVSPMEGGGDPVPVPGATVELRSLFPGALAEMVSGETDDEGNVVLDIAQLSARGDDGEPLNGIYQFNGSLTVRSPKSRKNLMREFSTGLVRVSGASVIVAGTHALDDMSVYPERITFDRWDVHYSENTFFRSSLNDLTHTFSIRLLGATRDVEVKLADRAGKAWGGGERTATAKYDPSTGLATADFEGEFLNLGNEDECLPEGDTTLRFSYTYDGDSYWTDVVFSAMDAPMEGAVSSTNLAPMFTNPNKGFAVTIPIDTGVPSFLTGVEISCWTPRLPLQVQFSPTNFILSLSVDLAYEENGLEPKQDDEKPALNG